MKNTPPIVGGHSILYKTTLGSVTMQHNLVLSADLHVHKEFLHDLAHVALQLNHLALLLVFYKRAVAVEVLAARLQNLLQV